MGLFDRFKKKTAFAYELPKRYEGLVTSHQYEKIIEITLQFHTDAGFPIVRVGDGVIVSKIGDEEQQRFLDNLIRLLAQESSSEWKGIIYGHFDKLKDQTAAYNFFYKDFDHAEPLLRVLVKPDDYFDFTGDKDPGYISRIDLPGTHSYLVIEFENQFNYISESDIVEWNKPIDDLFQIAIDNLPGDEVEVKSYIYLDRFDVFVFFSGDFSASLMLDIEQRADFVVGKFGSMIAIPTKGTAFAHPIETDDILDLAVELAPSVIKFYEEDPGNITTELYWYYQGKFQPFRLQDKDGQHFIFLPEGLEEIFLTR